MEDLAAFAEELARTARLETLRRWTGDYVTGNKSPHGFDPVTDADLAAEEAMRALIERRFPGHGVSGEEFPERSGAEDLSWSLDPIDGTRSFICGLPIWSTLVALLQGGQPILGLIDVPGLSETYLGHEGRSWLIRPGSRDRIRSSDCTSLAGARAATTDPFLFDEEGAAGFDRIRRRARTARYGLDGYAYAKLAAGGIDLVVESGLKPHDYHALIPLVSGAGGMIADWQGGQDYVGGKVLAAATSELFDEALSCLRGA